MNTPFVSLVDNADYIHNTQDYSDLGGFGLKITFKNGLQLSIIEDRSITTLEFELAIYNNKNEISPEYFDHNDRVIDVLRGCDAQKVNTYINKLARL